MSNLHVPELVVLLLVAVCSISSQKYPDDFKLILTNQTVSLSPYPVDFGSRAFDSQNKIGLSAEDPDANKDVIELVRSRGFQVKTYNPITPDGYILTAFRIINPFNQRPRLAKPVMLQHGFETSASSWVWQPEGKATAPLNPRSVRKGTITNGSLGFVLANYGYDVWLTNFRGTRYATNHTRLGSPGQTGQYWEFSVNELSRFDIPTYLRYIQKVTKQMEVAFVGHSLATAAMFATLATFRDLNDYVKPVIMLGPITRTSNAATVLALSKYAYTASTLGLRYAPFSLAPHTKIGSDSTTMTCGLENVLQPLCLLLLGMSVGYNREQMNTTRFPVYFSNFPEGTSSWVYNHYLQNAIYKQLTMYDYGPIENARKYGNGQMVPPKFDLSLITNQHIALFYSKNDYVADYQDVLWTKEQLKVTPMVDYVIPDERWNHFDYVWANDLGKFIVPQIVRTLVKAGVF